MKLRELIEKIDKTNPRLRDDTNFYKLGSIFNLDLYFYNNEGNDRLKCYWMQTWLCTDSWVGWRAYFLDDELVAVSSQLGRKCDEEFELVPEKIKILKEYLETLVENPLRDDYDLINLDEEVGDDYGVEFQSQLLDIFHEKGMYEGQEVTVKRIKGVNDYSNFHNVIIVFPDKTQKTVDCRDIRFEFCKTF